MSITYYLQPNPKYDILNMCCPKSVIVKSVIFFANAIFRHKSCFCDIL